MSIDAAAESGGTNEFEAAAKIAALSRPPQAEKPRDETGKFAPRNPPAENPDTTLPLEQPEDVEAPAEQGAPSEDDEIDIGEVETEQANAPALGMPESWGKTASSIWDSLPPEAQQFIQQHETKRRAGISRELNELSAAQEQARDQARAIEQERLQLAQAAQRFQSEAVRQFKAQFGDVTDVQKLASENPARFLEMQGAWMKVQQAHGEAQQWTQALQAENVRKIQEFRQEQNAKLAETLGLDDDTKAQAFETEIIGFAKEVGITEHRLAQYTADEILLLRDGMKYRRAVAKKAQASKQAAQPPRVIRPGSPATGSNSRQQVITQLSQKLKKTGRVEDAAARIKAGWRSAR